MNALAYAVQLLQLIVGLIPAAEETYGIFQAQIAALQQMQAENRDPSPAEWDALNALIQAERDKLHSA